MAASSIGVGMSVARVSGRGSSPDGFFFPLDFLCFFLIANSNYYSSFFLL